MGLFSRDEETEMLQQQIVPTRPAPQPVQRTPLENAAIWLRNLRYEDMMQLATEMHSIKAGDALDTPEQMAKLVHAWAKTTTEQYSHVAD